MIKPNDDAVRVALDNIEIQMNAMRSLKGWRLNLIRKHLSDAKAAIASTPSQAVQAEEAGRNAVIEECAKVAEDVGNDEFTNVHRCIAKAIRSLATRTGE